MKRITPCSPKASRMGMLWMEMTPNAVLTPHSSRKAAIAAPTVTSVLCLGMTGYSSGNIDMASGRVRRQRSGQKNYGAGGFFGPAEPAELYVLALGKRAGPVLPGLGGVFALF